MKGIGDMDLGSLKGVLAKIPDAVWEGLIEWGKAESKRPSCAFLLGFFRRLQLGMKEIPIKERSEIARILRCARFEDIESELKVMKIELKETRILAAGALKAIGELSEFRNGQDFDTPSLIKALLFLRRISRREKEDLLRIFRNSLLNIESRMESIDTETQEILNSCGNILGYLSHLEDLLIRVHNVILDQEQMELESSYLQAIEKKYGELELLGIGYSEKNLPLDRAFVSLSISESGQEGGKTNEAEAILADRDELVIIGSAGAGKSTLLQWEAFQCTRGEILTDGKHNPWNNIIPFFIRLRFLDVQEAFPNPNKWAELSVPEWARAKENHGRWIEKLIKQGRCLLILDGLDEMNRKLRPDFWRELGKLVRDQDIMYRVASRPFHKKGENDEEWDPPFRAAMVRVLPLSREKADSLIDNWHKAAIINEISEQNKASLRRYPAALKDKLWRQSVYRKISELTQTPLLCAAICVINRYSEEKLPLNKAHFHEMLCKALLERDERKKKRDGSPSSPDSHFDKIDFDVLFHIHSQLAFHMIMNPRQDSETTDPQSRYQVKESQILEWLKDPIMHIADPETCRKAEMERKEFLRHLLDRRNLLREPSKGWIDFHHRGLQEYLAASSLAKMSWINFLVDHALDDRLRDIIILSPGGYQVDEDFPKELIDQLLLKGNATGKRVYYCLAVASLETAKHLSQDFRKKVLQGLLKILPPKSLEEARTLAAAGNAAIPHLGEILRKNKDQEIKTFCALSLLCIGGEKALIALGEDLDFTILLNAFIQSPPGTEILELPPVLSKVKQSGIIPERVREHVRNLSPLSLVENLQYLDISDCEKITDISPLESQKEISRLNLSRCINLENINPVSRLLNLKFLSLRCCGKISDINPLENLSKLESLDLGYCSGIEDFSPLQSLPNLKSLDLQGVKIPEGFQLPKSLPYAPTPGLDFLEITDGLYMKMVWIQGGEFPMGSEEGKEIVLGKESPIHPVELDGFWIGSTPVTQAQYKAIMMGKDPSHFKDDDLPVECVSWNESKEFCKELSAKTGREYSLPTEAQWEFACRAGSSGRFCFGDMDQRLEHYAWYEKNSENKTHPVGLKRSNAWGLFDMHGNVWELCADWYGEYEKEKCKNPKGPKDGKYKVLRGGSWFYLSVTCRSACRRCNPPDSRPYDLGFRVVFVARTQKA